MLLIFLININKFIQLPSYDCIFQVEEAKEVVAQAEEYKNKSRKKKIILGVIAGVVVILIIVAVSLG